MVLLEDGVASVVIGGTVFDDGETLLRFQCVTNVVSDVVKTVVVKVVLTYGLRSSESVRAASVRSLKVRRQRLS